MAKSKHLKALVTGAVTMALSCSMLVGTTFAWFTDSVTSNKNTIATGNLDVELSYWTKADKWESVEGKSDLFDPNALWEPGHTEIVYLQISNEGSLDVNYRFSLDVFGETHGKTKNGDEIVLSSMLQFGFVNEATAEQFGTNRSAAIAAVDTVWTLEDTIKHEHNQGVLKGTMKATDEAKTFAIVLWLPTTVGNEANSDGVNVPSVDLGTTLVASQINSENDSFGNDYDENVPLPEFSYGTATINRNDDKPGTEFDIRSNTGAKVAHVKVPETAVDSASDSFALSIKKTDLNENITITSDQAAQTYEITATGLKSGNTEAIQVWLRVGAGLTNVEVWHNETKIVNPTYPVLNEYVVFNTTSFSPFTIVYDKEPTVVDPSSPQAVPVAGVERATQFEGEANAETIEWNSYGGFSPTEGYRAVLDAAYKFSMTQSAEEVENSYYRDWHCDFFVSLDRDLTPEKPNAIFLAGCYGAFGWVGFHSGELELPANTKVPLLGSVGGTFTYEMVADLVGEFICGVGAGTTDGYLSGATFTVELRLTNPENLDDIRTIQTITYTFA